MKASTFIGTWSPTICWWFRFLTTSKSRVGNCLTLGRARLHWNKQSSNPSKVHQRFLHQRYFMFYMNSFVLFISLTIFNHLAFTSIHHIDTLQWMSISFVYEILFLSFWIILLDKSIKYHSLNRISTGSHRFIRQAVWCVLVRSFSVVHSYRTASVWRRELQQRENWRRVLSTDNKWGETIAGCCGNMEKTDWNVLATGWNSFFFFFSSFLLLFLEMELVIVISFWINKKCIVSISKTHLQSLFQVQIVVSSDIVCF